MRGSSRHYFYILDEAGNVSATDDRDAWGKWFQTQDRRVAFDIVGPAEVSTVFLGLDHNFGDGPPILFETLVFAPREDGEYVGVENSMRRYATKEEAIEGHREIVLFLRGIEDEESTNGKRRGGQEDLESSSGSLRGLHQ